VVVGIVVQAVVVVRPKSLQHYVVLGKEMTSVDSTSGSSTAKVLVATSPPLCSFHEEHKKEVKLPVK